MILTKINPSVINATQKACTASSIYVSNDEQKFLGFLEDRQTRLHEKTIRQIGG